jgi:hypothetical protein
MRSRRKGRSSLASHRSSEIVQKKGAAAASGDADQKSAKCMNLSLRTRDRGKQLESKLSFWPPLAKDETKKAGMREPVIAGWSRIIKVGTK